MIVAGHEGAIANVRKDENDPGNTKLASNIAVHSASEDDLLFLPHIGLRWVHADFGGDAPCHASAI